MYRLSGSLGGLLRVTVTVAESPSLTVTSETVIVDVGASPVGSLPVGSSPVGSSPVGSSPVGSPESPSRMVMLPEDSTGEVVALVRLTPAYTVKASSPSLTASATVGIVNV